MMMLKKVKNLSISLPMIEGKLDYSIIRLDYKQQGKLLRDLAIFLEDSKKPFLVVQEFFTAYPRQELNIFIASFTTVLKETLYDLLGDNGFSEYPNCIYCVDVTLSAAQLCRDFIYTLNELGKHCAWTTNKVEKVYDHGSRDRK